MTTTLTSTSTATAPAARATRSTPPLGGFSPTFLRLELRRMLRNKRSVIFTLVMPSAFFLLFGTSSDFRHQRDGYGNLTAYVMISMAVYGSMIATTSGGAIVATERALGWSRQLRLTPLRPIAYITTKVFVAMTTGLIAIVVVLGIGRAVGADMPIGRMIACAVLGWLCTFVFAAFGLLMGYLLPSENVMQVLGPVLALASFGGGLFQPLDQMPHVVQVIAPYSPVYGVGVIARWPLTSSGNLAAAVANVVIWTTLFVAGAAYRFRRDTARV